MKTRTPSPVNSFVLAAFSILIAVLTGVAWLGQPLRMVQLMTLVGSSVAAGVSLAQAVARLRQRNLPLDSVSASRGTAFAPPRAVHIPSEPVELAAPTDQIVDGVRRSVLPEQ